MNIELQEIRSFLANIHPFDLLPEKTLSDLPEKLQTRYFRRGSEIPDTGTLFDHLYLIRTGTVELNTSDGELQARLGENDMFGYRSSHVGGRDKLKAFAMEDTLVYQLRAADLYRICHENVQRHRFFDTSDDVQSRRQRETTSLFSQSDRTQLNLMLTPVRELLRRTPVKLPVTATIDETVKVMRQKRVSSVLIYHEPERRQKKLVGIVTDRDLRNRVIAKDLDLDDRVSEIMTENPVTINSSDFVFKAQLQMVRYNVHHMPVMADNRPAGMITTTDLTRAHTCPTVSIIGDIYKHTDIDRIKEVTAKIPELLVNLIASGAAAMSIGRLITSITDAVTIRLLELAEKRLGPAPVAYAWVAAGSQAREEQIAKTDQDNILILADDYIPKAHSKYFSLLAGHVCDGLNACGYIYCPGDMMATNYDWRQPLKIWKKNFNQWIDRPEPEALMLTSVFFDLRCIYGNRSLFQDLRDHVLGKTRDNQIFLAHMTMNALSHQPPLGFFRNFILIKGGEHDQTFDIKLNGIIPIVDLVRVYALARCSTATNTLDRLDLMKSSNAISTETAGDLHDALEFISNLRIQHQAGQVRAGKKMDNFVSPDTLSHADRNRLKEAFLVIRNMQSVMKYRYQR
nr:putative nucleotidyltransferase substrate binding domain-containing protein [uncultured Desulfobacter sp.]